MIQDQTAIVAEELDQAVGSIFETMMGLAVSLVTPQWSGEPDRVAATVQFTGSRSSVIVLEVSPGMACFLAGRFLGIDAPEAVDNDVRDVLGELANMIGGNLKSAMAPDATLSIPEVVDGVDFKVRFCGGSPTFRQAFACEGGEFWISLIQARASQY